MGKKVGILLSCGKVTYCVLVVVTATQKILKMKINDFVMCCENPSKNRNQLKQTKHKTRKPLETLESLCLTAALCACAEPAHWHVIRKPEYPLKSCNSSNYSFLKLELDNGLGELDF